MYSISVSATRPMLLKDSIRDVVRLQQTYDPSDELLWVFFNARVLLNQPIAVDDFVQQAYTTDSSLEHPPVYVA